jgi:hypothetical protein
MARQYDNIAESDRELGRLLGEHEEDDVLDNTIVMIWSDHGEGLPGAKRWLYDSGTRVPLIVRLPQDPMAGTSSTQLVSLIDLAPTVLSICGIPPPSHLQGIPFLGNSKRDREFVFGAFDRLPITTWLERPLLKANSLDLSCMRDRISGKPSARKIFGPRRMPAARPAHCATTGIRESRQARRPLAASKTAPQNARDALVPRKPAHRDLK